MKNVRKLALLAVLALPALEPLAVQAQTPAPAATTQPKFADGNDWTKASLSEKRAFLFGIANAISVGVSAGTNGMCPRVK